jgi:hypothetical protein
MLHKYADVLKCEVCGGNLYFDGDSTVDEYALYMSITHKNIHDKINDIINDYLVYVCESCGRAHKYTSREVEFKLRRTLTQRALMILIKDLIDPNKIMFNRYLIYCGKCQGFDGNGCCPKSIFEPCPIKRFPINECL